MIRSSQQLSAQQQKILNVLPIPSAPLISILGSTAIIHLACLKRKVTPWTPYTRLLVAMSVCDIIFSLNIAIGTFLRPKETSDRVWAFGNDTTCSFVGFMNQVGFSGIWYQGMLSIYFLLTARFGMKNERIAKIIEPIMHFLALGYNFGGAIASITSGVYAERNGAISCYVGRDYGDSDASQAEKQRRDMMVQLLYKFPVLVVTSCLICTQVSIYFIVRSHTRKDVSSEVSEADSINRDTSLGLSERSMLRSKSKEPSKEFSRISRTVGSSASIRRQKTTPKKSADTLSLQSRRLWLVCTQAFLFVCSFMLCNAWNIFMATAHRKAQNREEEMAATVKYFPVAVIQAKMMPIQGLFNCLIFIRPKYYLMLRLEFPNEGKRWTVKRMFLGKKLKPTVPNAGKSDEHIGIAAQPQHRLEHDDGDEPIGDTKNSKSNATCKSRTGRNMISSLTATGGDFDSVIDALREDDRWQDASNHVQQSKLAGLVAGVCRLTDLEDISETSESVFELTPCQLNGSHHSNSFSLPIPYGQSEGRWRDAKTAAPLLVDTAESSSEQQRRPSGIDSKPSKVSPDVPIRVPTRTSDAQDDLAGRANSNIGQQRAKEVADVPLSLPRRLNSLPPSEIEDA